MAVILGSFALLAIFALLAFASFDSILGIEYRNHREQWEKDGKPLGFFYMLPESRTPFNNWMTGGLMFVWLFRSPYWMKEESNAKKWQISLRLFTLLYNIGGILWFFYICPKFSK